MNAAEKADRVREFRRKCHERNERVTMQRTLILETILDLDNHPSAERIYDAVEKRLPGIARTTVYRTLEHLARVGIITKACHPGRTTRFDPRTRIHHHLVCLHCNEITDFEHHALDRLPMPDTSALGFEVDEYRVQIRGTCRKCREHEMKEETR